MYFSSIEFTDFEPFAKGSRMEFAPVPDKPDDLAEVHLITGENGTGKSRLLCLLAAALGDARALQARCRKEDQLEFAAAWRKETEAEGTPLMRLRLGREGLVPVGTRSDTIFKEVRNTQAFARAGVSFLEDADLSKPVSESPWKEGRLSFRPGGAYTEGLLDKLHKIVVASRLQESPRMMALTARLEQTMSEVVGGKFDFFPENFPERTVCVNFGRNPRLSMNQCPDGLRSLVGWLVDAALVMDDLANSDRPALEAVSKKYRDRSIRIAARLESLKEELSDLDDHRDNEKFSELIAELHFLEEEDHELEIARATELSRHTSEGLVSYDMPCIILLDEIETHLHPAWQRRVLPAFQKMFPKAQIFVATHSPFVISSVNYGCVHILRRGEDGVRVQTADASKGDSYMEAVQQVLGIKERFDPETEDMLKEYRVLRDAVMAGAWDRLEEVKKAAAAIGERGPALKHMMTQELWQLERAKPQVQPA